MKQLRVLAVIAALAGATVLAVPTAADAVQPAGRHPGGPAVHATPGAAGAGDPYFPLSGNGGFDISHYGLDIGYVPATGKLTGRAVISATATQNLSRFDLDLSGLTVASVAVNGHSAKYSRSGQELVITPSRYLPRGQHFTVDIRYSGVPAYVQDPDGSADGWIRTDTGAFVASEPQGAMTWFPANSQPIDKSSFDVTITVPKGYQAVGNGQLVSQRSTTSTTTTRWQQRQPMAAYLATASIGKFQISSYRADGMPVYVAVDPREATAAAPVLAKLPEILAWEQQTFGRYPFSSTGAIVMHAPFVGLRPGDADPAAVRPRAGRLDPGARAGPPVVRGLGERDPLEGHLAERGLRHLRGVALGRAQRHAERAADVRRPVRLAGR